MKIEVLWRRKEMHCPAFGITWIWDHKHNAFNEIMEQNTLDLHIRSVSVGVSSTQLPRLEIWELCQWSVMVMTLLSHFMTLLSSLLILLVYVSKFNVHNPYNTPTETDLIWYPYFQVLFGRQPQLYFLKYMRTYGCMDMKLNHHLSAYKIWAWTETYARMNGWKKIQYRE